MQEFYYSGLNPKGKEAFGSLRAENAEEAKRLAEAKGFRKVVVKSTLSQKDQLSAALSKIQPVSLRELALTCRQLAVMLKAGLGIQHSIEVILRQPLGERLKRAWESVHKDLNGGSYLSAAMARHKPVFGNLFIGMAKAGESSGTLAENIARVADHMEAEHGLRQRIKAALTYPAIVFIVSIAIAVAIVQHILPSFLNSLFSDTGMRLPLPTKILIVITNFFNDPRAMGIALAILVIGSWMLWKHLQTPAGRQQLDRLFLKLPLSRELSRKVLAVRLARSVSTLVNSGLPVAPSLELSAEAVDHSLMSEYLKTAVQDLRDGNTFSDAMRAVPILPPIFASFAELGEQTGQIPYLLEQLAKLFDQDVEQALHSMTQLIEPIMVAVMGGFVAFVLVSVFLPLYQILGSF